MLLSELIRTARAAKRLKQADLGKLIGVSGGAVGNWERGSVIAQDNLDALVSVLGMDLSTVSAESLNTQVGRARSTARGKKPEKLETPRKSSLAYPSIDGPAVSRYAVPVKKLRLGPHASFFEQLREALPENRRSNLDFQLNMGGLPCSFDYLSDRLVANLELRPIPPTASPRCLWLKNTPKLLWDLAVARQFLSPESKPIWPRFTLFVLMSHELLVSKPYERLTFEARVMGIDLKLFSGARDLATLIESIECESDEADNAHDMSDRID